METDQALRGYCRSYAVNYTSAYWSVPNISELLEKVLLQIDNPYYDLPSSKKDELAMWTLIEVEESCWLLLFWPKLLEEATKERWSPGKMQSTLLQQTKKMKKRVISFARCLLEESRWERLSDWWMSWMWWLPRTTKTRKWFEDEYNRFHTDRVFEQCKDFYYRHYKPTVENSH